MSWTPAEKATGLILFSLLFTVLYRSGSGGVELLQSNVEEVGDGGGLEVQEQDLGWGARSRRKTVRGWDKAMGSSWIGGESEYRKRSADIDARLRGLSHKDGWDGREPWEVYKGVKEGIRKGFTAMGKGNLMEAPYELVGNVGEYVAPQVLSEVERYFPVAFGAQQQLSDALRLKKKNDVAKGVKPIRKYPRQTQFQYGLALNDEYETREQAPIRIFHESDVPKLKCKGEEGMWPKMVWPDCELKEGKAYNRMFFIDRRMSNKPASLQMIKRRMNGVKRLAMEWKPLLVAKKGTLSFDDPYFWCYDQFQEDPEFSICLRKLMLKSKKEGGGEEEWAKAAMLPDDDLRTGFPNLRKEWEKELGDGRADAAQGNSDHGKEKA